MFHLGFFVGWVIGIFTALLLLYIIRREMEKVADGERVITTNKSLIHDDPLYVDVRTGKYSFRSYLIEQFGLRTLCDLLTKGILVKENEYKNKKGKKR